MSMILFGLRKNNYGVSSFAIMLLALLVLTVVLVDGIAISVKKNEEAKAGIMTGEQIALNYCSQSHEIFPVQCKISRVYKCDEYYILRTGCIGVGDVIINNNGEYVNWCGYTSLEGEAPECGQYWIDIYGQDCTENNNLCLNI